MTGVEPPGAGAQARAYVTFFAPVTGQFLDPLAEALGPPAGRVLDLGCGEGGLARLLSARGWTVVAVDSSARMAAAARAGGCADVLIADGQALPLRAGACAAAGAAFVLPHLQDLGAGLRELHRVVAPGGSVALTGWAAPRLSPFTGLLGTLVLDRSGGGGGLAEAQRRTDADYLATHARRAGFVDVSVRTVTTTVVLASAVDWWTGMVTASFGMGRAVAALAPADRRDIRARFLAGAHDFEILDGEIFVPAAALLVTGERPA
jgi:SAM-dependent methyltransferase